MTTRKEGRRRLTRQPCDTPTRLSRLLCETARSAAAQPRLVPPTSAAAGGPPGARRCWRTCRWQVRVCSPLPLACHALTSPVPGLCAADEYTIQSLLEQLPCGHAEAREALRARALNELYPRWTALLQAGFSVLVYGVGSKKQLLEEFQHHLGLDGAVVVVNGWHPTLRAKHILAACLAAVAPSDAALRGRGCGELLAALQAVLPCVRSGHQRRLYLLLNNIDGQQLRGGEAQGMLADLAAVPNVHLVASADSVNFPLLWNKRNAARMRWAWEHAPTYAPYTAETEVVARALTGRGEERLLRGASHVLLSLTPNARTVFRLLAEAQLQNSDIGGLTFAQWYALCRAQLSVASEDALRIHLGEFLDHNLVKKLRRSDGVELLAIQFSADDLKQILEDVGGPAH